MASPIDTLKQPDVQASLADLSAMQQQATAGQFIEATVAFNIYCVDPSKTVPLGQALDAIAQLTAPPKPAAVAKDAK
jgi:hypothetical protein